VGRHDLGSPRCGWFANVVYDCAKGARKDAIWQQDNVAGAGIGIRPYITYSITPTIPPLPQR